MIKSRKFMGILGLAATLSMFGALDAQARSNIGRTPTFGVRGAIHGNPGAPVRFSSHLGVNHGPNWHNHTTNGSRTVGTRRAGVDHGPNWHNHNGRGIYAANSTRRTGSQGARRR